MAALGRSVVVAALLALACIGSVRPALAEPQNWLVLEGACPANADDLARRVDQALIGARPADARARVDIEAVAEGYRVTLYAARAGRDLGGKQLVTPSCGEAADAAVLVLALALTEPGPPEVPPEAVRRSTSPALSPPPIGLVAPPSASRDEPAPAREGIASSLGHRAGVLFGVESGVAPQPAPYLGASFTVGLDAWELWSGVRYGLPTEEESVETASSEKIRRDFGAIGLSLCRGAGARWRLSLCIGGEVGVVRVDRTRRDRDVEVETDEDRARLAGVGTLRLVGGLGRVRPELEFSAAAAAGGAGAAPHLGLRLGAGVGVQF